MEPWTEYIRRATRIAACTSSVHRWNLGPRCTSNGNGDGHRELRRTIATGGLSYLACGNQATTTIDQHSDVMEVKRNVGMTTSPNSSTPQARHSTATPTTTADNGYQPHQIGRHGSQWKIRSWPTLATSTAWTDRAPARRALPLPSCPSSSSSSSSRRRVALPMHGAFAGSQELDQAGLAVRAVAYSFSRRSGATAGLL